MICEKNHAGRCALRVCGGGWTGFVCIPPFVFCLGVLFLQLVQGGGVAVSKHNLDGGLKPPAV